MVSSTKIVVFDNGLRDFRSATQALDVASQIALRAADPLPGTKGNA